MKTYIGYLIFMCSLLLCSCQQTTSNPRFYDEGVSQELATLRKQEIKELKYKLYFSIPEQKSVPVNGEIAIEFNLDAPQEIILDFREKPEKIKSVSVNGQTARYEFHNEHIILPEKNIVEGKNNITIKFIAGNQSLSARPCPYLIPLFRTAESESHIFLTTGYTNRMESCFQYLYY